MLPLKSMIPNPNQPRMANLLDNSLRLSLLETRGLTTPILVEKLDEKTSQTYIKKLKERYEGSSGILAFLEGLEPRYVIIDGERRWCNSVTLLQENPEVKEFLGEVPVDIITEGLSEKDRYVIWVSIHKIRKDWRAMEKETAAYHLIDLVDPKTAANILGVTLSQLQKFIETYRLAQRMRKGAKERAISYARETMSLSKRIRPPEVIDAVVDKVNRGLIRDATDIRQLRDVLDDAKVRKEFLKPSTTIDSVASTVPTSHGQLEFETDLKHNLVTFRQQVEKYGWRDVAALRGDAAVVKDIDETIKVLGEIKRAIA